MHILVALAFFAFAALVSPSFARRDLVEFNPNIDWVCKLFDSTGPLGGLPVMRYRARLGLDETLSDNWCGACKRLKSTMKESGNTLVDVSKQYIMVSVDGKENDSIGESYSPDGQYIPRIILCEPSGKVRPDLVMPNGNPKYKYFPGSADSVAAMLEQHALALIKDVNDEL